MPNKHVTPIAIFTGILNVALEFLPNGNLRDYLRSIRPLHQKGAQWKRGDASTLTFSNLLKLGIDVAKGMEHLAATGVSVRPQTFSY